MNEVDKGYVGTVQCERAGRTPDLECRAEPRVDVAIPVHITPIMGPGAPVRPRLGRECQAIDISRSGMRVLWRGAPPPEELVIRLKDAEGGSVLIEAKRVWWQKVVTGRHDMGIQFRGLHPTSDASAEYLLEQDFFNFLTGTENKGELGESDILDLASFG